MKKIKIPEELRGATILFLWVLLVTSLAFSTFAYVVSGVDGVVKRSITITIVLLIANLLIILGTEGEF